MISHNGRERLIKLLDRLLRKIWVIFFYIYVLRARLVFIVRKTKTLDVFRPKRSKQNSDSFCGGFFCFGGESFVRVICSRSVFSWTAIFRNFCCITAGRWPVKMATVCVLCKWHSALFLARVLLVKIQRLRYDARQRLQFLRRNTGRDKNLSSEA